MYSDDIYAHYVVFGLIYFSNGDFPNIALFVGSGEQIGDSCFDHQRW